MQHTCTMQVSIRLRVQHPADVRRDRWGYEVTYDIGDLGEMERSQIVGSPRASEAATVPVNASTHALVAEYASPRPER